MNWSVAGLSTFLPQKIACRNTHLCFLLLLSFLAPVANATISPESIYVVGNSLSWDAINAGALSDLFRKGGVTINMDYHIRCGSSLTNTVANPDDACELSDDGPWDVALSSNKYDLLVLQPHENGSTTESEIDAMGTLASLTNSRVAIYEAYPDYEAAADIKLFYESPDQTEFRQSLAEFTQIEHAFPEAIVIPAMEVLVTLDSLARAGQVPGISTAQDFYRDARHLNGIGKYILGLTFFSSISGLDPSLTGLEFNPAYGGISEQQALVIQNVVSDVVLKPVPLSSTLWLFGTGVSLIGSLIASTRHKGQQRS